MNNYTYATPAQIATRLREMAAEVQQMSQRLGDFTPATATREHPAVNAKSAVGGTVNRLKLAAGLVAEVDPLEPKEENDGKTPDV